jgi:hypothetical protein
MQRNTFSITMQCFVVHIKLCNITILYKDSVSHKYYRPVHTTDEHSDASLRTNAAATATATATACVQQSLTIFIAK